MCLTANVSVFNSCYRAFMLKCLLSKKYSNEAVRGLDQYQWVYHVAAGLRVFCRWYKCLIDTRGHSVCQRLSRLFFLKIGFIFDDCKTNHSTIRWFTKQKMPGSFSGSSFSNKIHISLLYIIWISLGFKSSNVKLTLQNCDGVFTLFSDIL